MPIDFEILKKQDAAQKHSFQTVCDLAEQLRQYLNEADTQQLIFERHVLGASSALIQKVVLKKAIELGFQSERQGLFANDEVSALRPDYYRAVGNTGIILEVERGKTMSNNMDLLDLWKCHICEQASYLFLIVPQARPSANGAVQKHFKQAKRRLGTFFEQRNYVNVDAVYLFGY